VIWSFIVGALAYGLIASAGYETARKEMTRWPDGVAAFLHVLGLIALVAALLLAANSN
jgi:F0F1-type ATP synthase membrane subunit c/vacuolar-type H+-ATPase subunit K